MIVQCSVMNSERGAQELPFLWNSSKLTESLNYPHRTPQNCSETAEITWGEMSVFNWKLCKNHGFQWQ